MNEWRTHLQANSLQKLDELRTHVEASSLRALHNLGTHLDTISLERPLEYVAVHLEAAKEFCLTAYNSADIVLTSNFLALLFPSAIVTR